MQIAWRNIRAIYLLVGALFLVAAMAPVWGAESQMVAVDDNPAELIAADEPAADDYELKHFVAPEPDRLPASPGAAYAIGGGSSNKVTTCKVTNSASSQPPGGAADRVTGVPDLSTG